MVSGPTAPDMQYTIDLLRTESDALAAFLASLDTEGWGRQSACTAWSIADAAAHIAQGSQGSSLALTRARDGDPSPPEGARLLDAGERASEMTADRAIAFSAGKEATELLQAFNEGADLLVQTASDLQPEDWEKLSFHRRGLIPVHENVTRRIQEIAIHGWDIRSAFDPAAEISEAGAREIATVAHRWLNACFRAPGGRRQRPLPLRGLRTQPVQRRRGSGGQRFPHRSSRRRHPRCDLPGKHQRLCAVDLRPPGH